jgi:hypothetical protein
MDPNGKERSMNGKTIVVLIGVAVLLAGSMSDAGEVAMDNATLKSWEPLGPVGGQWAAQGGAWIGSAPGDNRWRLLVGGQARTDGALAVKLRVTRPAPAGGYYGGPAFCRYASGDRDGGYDAAVILRYQGPTAYYRVQVSTAYGEVALWKPTGGFLQVRPFAFRANEPYEIKAEAAGSRIRVWVNGQAVVDYWDRVVPVASGRAGIGVYNAQVRFERIGLEESGAAGDMPPRAPSRFAVRSWRRMNWIFDGDEPVAHLDKGPMVLWDVKLRPGYRPICYWDLHWKQYDGEHNYANKLDELVIEEENGPRLRARWTAQNPAKIVTSQSAFALTCDAAKNTYIYDLKTELVVNPGKDWKDTADGLEYCNLIPYNVVGPAATVSDPWPWEYRWILFHGDDGSLWKHPIHHNGIGSMHPKQAGGYYLYVPAEELLVVPAVEFENPTDPKLKPYAGLCHWAYDIHFRYRPYESQQIIPRGTRHTAHYRVLAYDLPGVRQSMANAKLVPEFQTDREFAVFVAGLNTFQVGRRYRDPHAEWAWENGIWDKSVGRDDSFSLRLERTEMGVSQCGCTTGSSFFMDGYTDGVYELSGWVKTKDAAGKGATLFVWSNDGKIATTATCPQRVAGTHDWTRLSFRPNNVRPSMYHVRIGLELDGTGKAWFDDVELKRVAGSQK